MRAVADPSWRLRASVLKQSERAAVLAGPVRVPGLDAGSVVVKSMTLGGLEDRLAVLLGRTRLMRQWRGAMTLREAGLGVARPIVLFRRRSATGRITETLVLEDAGERANGHGESTERKDGARVSLLHRMASGELSVRDEHEIARALGADLRAMFDAGVTNRDHKPSNIIALRRSGGAGGWRMVYVDTVGVRGGGKRVGAARSARTLASMVLEPLGVGHPARRGVMMRVLRTLHQSTPDPGALARRDWRAVAAIVRGHGDPTPKDDPLG